MITPSTVHDTIEAELAWAMNEITWLREQNHQLSTQVQNLRGTNALLRKFLDED